MAKIHPTAIVDSRAQLADDVEVGPYCVIEGDVQIGAGTVLLRHVVLEGPLKIGERNIIHAFAAIGGLPNDRSYDVFKTDHAGVVVGDDNVLREGVTIHRATQQIPTTLGSNNYLMCHVHLAHDCKVGSHCNIANAALLAGHVEVDDYVTIGGHGSAAQYCRIGRLAMLSGLIGVTQDLPPFCMSYNLRMVGSLNNVGLRRAGLREHIPNLQRAYKLFFKSGLSNKTAVERIRKEVGGDPLCLEFAAFIETTKRGICPQESRKKYVRSVDPMKEAAHE